MREIHLARLDKNRPCLVLTREAVRPYRSLVTVAGITHSIHGLASEVQVDLPGIRQPSVINMDDVQTISADDLIRLIGYFPDDREPELTSALVAAFDLDLP